MTNDELRLTFKSLSAATEGIVREAFRRRAEWKKRIETDAAIRDLAASDGVVIRRPTDVLAGQPTNENPTEGAIGSAREGK